MNPIVLIVLAIFMNLLGIVICFLTKFNNRSNKDLVPTWSFWWKDNWNEFVVTVLFDIAVMILFLTGDIKIDVTKFLPEWVLGAGGLTISFLIGLALAALIYEIFKIKQKQIKQRYIDEKKD